MSDFRLIGRYRELGSLVADSGAILSTEITVEIHRRPIEFTPIFLRSPVLLHDDLRWSAEVFENYADEDRSRDFLDFGSKHYGETVSVGRFGKGVIEHVEIEPRVVRVPGDIVDGELTFTYATSNVCKMTVHGIGCVTIHGDMQHVPEERRVLA